MQTGQSYTGRVMKQVNKLQEYLEIHMDCGENEMIYDMLWKELFVFEGYTFQTGSGAKVWYQIKDNEIIVKRKENAISITKSLVGLAVAKVLQLRGQKIYEYSPKDTNMSDAQSFLY